MSKELGVSPEAIIAEGIRVYVEGYLDGYGAVEDTPRERAHLAEDIAENMAEVLMERLRDGGHTIVPSGRLREAFDAGVQWDQDVECGHGDLAVDFDEWVAAAASPTAQEET